MDHRCRAKLQRFSSEVEVEFNPETDGWTPNSYESPLSHQQFSVFLVMGLFYWILSLCLKVYLQVVREWKPHSLDKVRKERCTISPDDVHVH
jgi:hypothetical protein